VLSAIGDVEEAEVLSPLSTRLGWSEYSTTIPVEKSMPTYPVRRPFYAQLSPIKSDTIRRNTMKRRSGIIGDCKRHVTDTFRRARSMLKDHKRRADWGNVREEGLQIS